LTVSYHEVRLMYLVWWI